MKKQEFSLRGGIISSSEKDKEFCYQASNHGSEAVYGRYELGCYYVAQVIEGYPNFLGLPSKNVQQVKIVNKDSFELENEEYYVFQLIKIQLGELRRLIKVKFRAIEKFDISTLKE